MLKLNEKNYFSNEARKIYTGSSEIKDFIKCEACALAKLNGEWIEEKSKSMMVSSYIDETPEKEEIDPIVLELLARKSVISQLEKDLSFSLWVSQIEHIPFQPFIDEIKEVVQKYDGK